MIGAFSQWTKWTTFSVIIERYGFRVIVLSVGFMLVVMSLVLCGPCNISLTESPLGMLITALSTIAKLWKEPKCPSTDERIKKMWYVYTMEYYSITKNNEILPFAMIWGAREYYAK